MYSRVRGRVLSILATLCIVGSTMLPAGANAASTFATPGGINPVGELDCNGHSAVQRPIKSNLLCADPHLNGPNRFEDNQSYIGHDEPDLRFISNAAGSGNNMQWRLKLPVEPTGAVPPKVTNTFELTPAFWLSVALCDPQSFPQNPCKPDSDKNTGSGLPTDAGSAFMELQFYPPGFSPFITQISCDQTHWCAALNIFSVACDASGACNANCTEPLNFAWIQTDGIPTGPAGPGVSTAATFTPNATTLMMGQGDTIVTTVHDTKDGLRVALRDLTTGQSGFMVASSANQFQHTNAADCSTSSFAFHPEYSTARAANVIPWAALKTNVSLSVETGHFTACTAVQGTGPLATCVGNDTTNPNPTFDEVIENSPCFAGPTIPGCLGFAANDADFDGQPYQLNSWPDGTSKTPSSLILESVLGRGDGQGNDNSTSGSQPNDNSTSRNQANDNSTSGSQANDEASSGAFHNPYPKVQFETDIGYTELGCDPTTGTGCLAFPPGANFYPFFSITRGESNCHFLFGADVKGLTHNDFGKTAQYGSPTPGDLGNLSGPIIANPCA